MHDRYYPLELVIPAPIQGAALPKRGDVVGWKRIRHDGTHEPNRGVVVSVDEAAGRARVGIDERVVSIPLAALTVEVEAVE